MRHLLIFILIFISKIINAQTVYFFPDQDSSDLNTSIEFSYLINFIGNEEATIEIIDEVILDEDHTIGNNIHLKFRKGGYIAGNGVLTINSSFESGLYKIFDENKTIEGNCQISYVYPQWFGAISNDNLSDDVAINRAIIFSKTSFKKAVFIPSGKYLLSNPLILKPNASIVGENLRGTIIETKDDFQGSAMIKTDDESYYNNIENIFLRNEYDFDNLVMLHTRQQWEGSYVKNIHLFNSGTVKGGIWHTEGNGSSSNHGGGQYSIENINVFYSNDNSGECKKEFVKLINSGGLFCRKWNINHKNMTSHSGPMVHLEVSTLIIDASDIHIETSPGNNYPSIKLAGSSGSSLNLTNSDITPYTGETFEGDFVGIEIDVTQDSHNSAEWSIENVVLKSGGGGSWYVDYKIPIRLKMLENNEIITKDVLNFENTDNRNYTVIRKFTNTEISLNKHPVDPQFQNAIGIKEGIINQQTIGTLNTGESRKIFTPHVMNNSNREFGIEEYTLSSGNNYQAKGYLVFISAIDNWGTPKGGLYQVITTFYEGTLRSNIIPISNDSSSSGLDLSINNQNELIVTNNSPRRLTRTSLIIIGTGTEKQ
ncbi:MAG: hypothetical protein HRT67_11585 [Flavobacteriaceae bacterium]|nr:hypothetical protein [Flavobacteriaceae bacterium]